MESKINQYIDKDDGMYHITFYKFINSVLVRNILNYRLYSIELDDGTVVRDPEFTNAKYVFKIHTDFLNKNIFFNAKFLINDIKNIKSFKFGLCDEKISWYKDHFIDIRNDLTLNNTNIELELKNEDYISKINFDSQLELYEITNDIENSVAEVKADSDSQIIDILLINDGIGVSTVTENFELEINQSNINNQDVGDDLTSKVITTSSTKKSWKKSKK